jgi:hypothetical protein
LGDEEILESELKMLIFNEIIQLLYGNVK